MIARLLHINPISSCLRNGSRRRCAQLPTKIKCGTRFESIECFAGGQQTVKGTPLIVGLPIVTDGGSTHSAAGALDLCMPTALAPLSAFQAQCPFTTGWFDSRWNALPQRQRPNKLGRYHAVARDASYLT